MKKNEPAKNDKEILYAALIEELEKRKETMTKTELEFLFHFVVS